LERKSGKTHASVISVIRPEGEGKIEKGSKEGGSKKPRGDILKDEGGTHTLA